MIRMLLRHGGFGNPWPRKAIRASVVRVAAWARHGIRTYPGTAAALSPPPLRISAIVNAQIGIVNSQIGIVNTEWQVLGRSGATPGCQASS